MAEFKSDPVLVLETMEQVREAAKMHRDDCFGPGFPNLDKWRVKSVWLISLIDEIVAAGKYPYNADVKQLAEQRLGFPPKTYAEYSNEGDTLSLLIYNAQGFRHSDMLHADGYVPFTAELLKQAYETGKLIEVMGENFIGASVTGLRHPKMINGQLYAMVPKKRKYHTAPTGQPVRLVDPPPKAKKPDTLDTRQDGHFSDRGTGGL